MKTKCNAANISYFTKSAFVQSRKKIKPEVFKKLSSVIVDEFYTDNDLSIKLWNNYRLLAVDGSLLTLPNTKELAEIYGVTTNQSKERIVQARVSILYDVLNEFILDGCMNSLSIGESKFAISHLESAKLNDLILYDRGYPSYNLMFEHFQRHIDFVIRTKTDFNNITQEFIKNGKSSQIVQIFPGKNHKITDKEYDSKTPLTVRLVRVILESGDVELLMTSLLDEKKYPDKIFKDLYFMRWKIETLYDELKNKLKIEHFSGYSNTCILQDFFAALFISNMQTLIVKDLIDETETNSSKKYTYKVNNNISYGLMKNRIIELCFSNRNTDELLLELQNLMKMNLIPIRNNRKFNRNTGKYRIRTKPKVLKNHKDSL